MPLEPVLLSLLLVAVAVIFHRILILKALLMRERQKNRQRARRRRLRQQRAAKKRIWARPWLLRRPLYGHHEHLLGELNREDQKSFKNFVRVPPQLFEEMVTRLTPYLQKKVTQMRDPLPVALKVAVTLRFMATGTSFVDLHYNFRVSISAISAFLPEVCNAIIRIYRPELLKLPKTPAEWKKVSDGFARKWNYNNCIGAIDGKHIPIRKPVGGGSYYFNYKKFHSIILLAVCDASYKFLFVNVGAAGSAGDAGTWLNSSLHGYLEAGTAGLPEPEPMPHDDVAVPYHLVGDDAFALKTYLMKPYSHRTQVPEERIFSYRLSRARRTIENAFGLLQNRLRVFGVPLYVQPRKAMRITLCGCVLHNLFLERIPMTITAREVDHENEDHQQIPGAWREGHPELQGLEGFQGQNPTRRAKAQRDYLSAYYASEAGEVPWQERIVFPVGRRFL